MVTVAEELPFVAVLDTEYLATSCSFCFSKGDKSRCIGCKVVSYCDKACQKKDWIDHKHECSFLKKYSPSIPSGRSRLMARIAMKLKRPDAKEPAFNGRVYDDLMDHRFEIMIDIDRLIRSKYYLNILGEYMGDNVPSPDVLLSIFGKVEINSFGIMNEGQCGQGLYVGISVHNHSCIPDATMTSDGRKALLRTTDPNKKYSKDLTVTYVELLWPNRDRQQFLRSSYYFTCTCERCSDPTLDFLYNSARSSCCPDSYCLLDPDAEELTCNKCGSVSEITVKEAIAANEEIKVFRNNDTNETNLRPDLTFDVPTLVEAYEKYSKILSPLNLNLLLLNERVEELPFAAAVASEYLGVICSSCFSSKGKKSRCIACKVVSYCDKNCQKKDWIDHKLECFFLKNYSPNVPPAICRVIARIAMKLKRPDGKKTAFNGRVFEDLMDHFDEMNNDPERLKSFFFIASVLIPYMGREYVPDPDPLFSIFGKVETNSFGISDETYSSGQGLYLGLSVHDHSCAPDAHVVFDGCKALLRSPDPSKKYSKDLTVTYTELLFSNRDRQEKLQAGYYFTCTCARCSDPTLDFLYNSVRSTCCPDSYCPLDPAAKELICNKCGTTSGITIEQAVTANEEVRVFDKNDNNQSSPDFKQGIREILEARPQSIRVEQESSNLQKIPVYRRYLNVGDIDLSRMLMYMATVMSYENPPTEKALKLYGEAFAAFSVSHGPKHHHTLLVHEMLSAYRTLLLSYRFAHNLGFRR